MRKKPKDNFPKTSLHNDRVVISSGVLPSGKILQDSCITTLTPAKEHQVKVATPSARRRANRSAKNKTTTTYSPRTSTTGYRVEAQVIRAYGSSTFRSRRNSNVASTRKFLRSLGVTFKIKKFVYGSYVHKHHARRRPKGVSKVLLRDETDLMMVNLSTTSPFLTDIKVYSE